MESLHHRPIKLEAPKGLAPLPNCFKDSYATLHQRAINLVAEIGVAPIILELTPKEVMSLCSVLTACLRDL